MDKSGEAKIDTAAKQEGCNDCPEIPVIVFVDLEYGVKNDQYTCDNRAKPDQEFHKIPFMMAVPRHKKALMVNDGDKIREKIILCYNTDAKPLY